MATAATLLLLQSLCTFKSLYGQDPPPEERDKEDEIKCVHFHHMPMFRSWIVVCYWGWKNGREFHLKCHCPMQTHVFCSWHPSQASAFTSPIHFCWGPSSSNFFPFTAPPPHLPPVCGKFGSSNWKTTLPDIPKTYFFQWYQLKWNVI